MNPIDRLLSIIAPHQCLGCGAEGLLLCNECTDKLYELPSICYMCGKATRNFIACEKCRLRHAPQHVWMVAAYDGHAKELLHAYKFEEKRAAAITIATLIAENLPHFVVAPLVVFVPTATSHKRARGFDHAELLAREIAKQKNWHYVRALHRASQVRQLGATRAQRKQQLSGVFRPLRPELIVGRHILLIDDVVTTGATVNECARVLYAAGASHVDAAVFARTMEK